jgi:ABC-type cobalamin transport system permease subunit
MKTKSFTLSVLAGTIIYYLLGGLFYGLLFPDIYPSEEQITPSFIFLGCVCYAIFYTYILVKLTSIRSLKSGFTIGLILGLINSVCMNFFMYSSRSFEIDLFVTDILIGTISTGIMTAIIAITLSKTE